MFSESRILYVFYYTYKERESVKKYIYCMDRMYDIYNKILRLIFTVYNG